MSISKRPDNLPGDFKFFYNAGSRCIIKIVVYIGNNIGDADNLPFKGLPSFPDPLSPGNIRPFPFGIVLMIPFLTSYVRFSPSLPPFSR